METKGSSKSDKKIDYLFWLFFTAIQIAMHIGILIALDIIKVDNIEETGGLYALSLAPFIYLWFPVTLAAQNEIGKPYKERELFAKWWMNLSFNILNGLMTWPLVFGLVYFLYHDGDELIEKSGKELAIIALTLISLFVVMFIWAKMIEKEEERRNKKIDDTI